MRAVVSCKASTGVQQNLYTSPAADRDEVAHASGISFNAEVDLKGGP